MGLPRNESLTTRARFKRDKEAIHQVISPEDHEECPRGIMSLPVEMLLEILSYLDPQDLYSLRKVSEYFSRLVRAPSLWKAYEVKENGPETNDVIEELKQMPMLERISIDTRSDCDEILRQLSLSNRKLERLRINDCTGSTGKLYLRSSYLTRILERCNRLHTIQILGSRFCGQKFYRLLGDMSTRLRTLSAQATTNQFRTFAKYARHLNVRDRDIMHDMCTGGKTWAPLRYFMLERKTRPFTQSHRTVLVSYLYNDFLSMAVGDDNRQDLQSCP